MRGETTSFFQRLPSSESSPDTKSGNDDKVSFAIGTRAMPVLPIKDKLKAEELDVNEVSKSKPTNDTSSPQLSNYGNGDNVSITNSEVVLRNPAAGRQLYQDNHNNFIESPRTNSLRHAHSTSDLIRIKHGKNKDSREMVLPVCANRPRSPYHISHSQSCNGLCVPGHYGSITNLNRLSTPQEHFMPYVPVERVGSVTFQNEEYYRKALTSQLSSSSNHHHKLPSLPEAKKEMFTDILTESLSIIYALLIVTLGVSLYLIDYLALNSEGIHLLSEGFSLTVLGLALSYLMFLNIDIMIYNYKKRKFEKLMETIQPEHMEIKETDEGVVYDPMVHKALTLRKKLDHSYCFNNDRHSSNFYLKIGAAGFCLGHLIHSFLILTYRGVVLNENTGECLNVLTFVIEIAYPIYSIILLFFIFKYSNVIINKNRDFHRFGFMHCLASSLCFWLWTIFRETAEYIQNSRYPTSEENNTVTQEYVKVRMITPFRFTGICEHDELNVIYQNFSPYLYPFSVEYSILVVGIIYIVWINIGLCAPKENDHDEHHHGEDTRECKNERRASEPESNVTIHADCHASNKGLFGGFIILVFSLLSVILFFITYYNDDKTSDLASTGLAITQATSLVVIILMIIAVTFAYFQMVKLDVNSEAHNSLDNFLCLMCLPAFFVQGAFSIIAGAVFGNVLAVIENVFEIIQVVIQTPFIMDGMSRSSNTKELRKKKPGREFVTFLVICNVACWLMMTFEVKAHGLDQYRQDFYGKELWSIVGHMCLPLMMFYRFHSSVCIGDIWKYAYMPSGH
ncbi:proton channel OtopLc-like isoform X2 [Anthonomus grandis grandis]|uniref:proton channel OtopLc-like isoform X2 n=1 Tax=Anthonomus grandis grandis TaxID=2921223 RepID=UPI0021657BEC|nr:proton channel OtopLc-like isoform X2 [Anthonomus grandis grandis]